MSGRDFVLPEDVQVVLPGVVVHRLGRQDQYETTTSVQVVDELIAGVPIP